jgi:predicted nucleic acid-binding protein
MADEPLVIDASVLAQLYIRDEEENFRDIAAALVRKYAEGNLELVAPEFILYEIPSAIQRAVRRRRLSHEDALLAIERFFRLNLRTLGTPSLPAMISSAYARASQLECRMYDALYLVVAEVLGYRFITADRNLYDRIQTKVDYMLWVEDYTA